MIRLVDWTIATWVAHSEAMRECNERFQAERDRRYTEVKIAEEQARRIKEQADRDALELSRQSQTYKDEKANELREQISRERGLYATKDDLKAAVDKMEAVIKPLVDFAATDRGRSQGIGSSWQILLAVIGLVFTLMGMASVAVTLVLYLSRTTPTPAIYTPAPQGTQLPTTPPAAVPR